MGFTGNLASLPGPVVVIAGPTAVGKSQLSLAVARAIDAEIVNADSMQLYRGMDIGTAKLPADRRQGIAHHLLDIWDVAQSADVASYQTLARRSIDDILTRGRIPVVVGGSGLYINALIDDLRFPGTDPVLRGELEAELESQGTQTLHARLAAQDPAAAAEILPSNGRRIVRALEVVALTGSFSARLPDTATPVYRTVYLAVDRDNADLDARIATRVDEMWRQGLVDEVAALRAHGLERGRTASRALGYRQVLGLLRDEISETDAAAETVTRTRRFVRRQRSWFRRDDRVHWLDAADGGLRDRALRTIATVGAETLARPKFADILRFGRHPCGAPITSAKGLPVKTAIRTVAVLVAGGLLFGLSACSGQDPANGQSPDDETSSIQESDTQSEDQPPDDTAAVGEFEGSWYLEAEATAKRLDIDAEGKVSGDSGGDHITWEGVIAPNDNGSFTMTINAIGKDMESVYTLTATDDPDVWEYVDEVNETRDVMERQD